MSTHPHTRKHNSMGDCWASWTRGVLPLSTIVVATRFHPVQVSPQRIDGCLDVNECLNNTLNICVDRSWCVNALGTFTCQCKPGFAGDGKQTCGNINECEDNPCPPPGICVDTVGSFRCEVRMCACTRTCTCVCEYRSAVGLWLDCLGCTVGSTVVVFVSCLCVDDSK
jgi:EGF domain-containing protein